MCLWWCCGREERPEVAVINHSLVPPSPLSHSHSHTHKTPIGITTWGSHSMTLQQTHTLFLFSCIHMCRANPPTPPFSASPGVGKSYYPMKRRNTSLITLRYSFIPTQTCIYVKLERNTPITAIHNGTKLQNEPYHFTRFPYISLSAAS